MNMLQHAGVYMPFVGAGLGPDMGPDMNLSKLEAPSWEPNPRMGLTELPDKSQVSNFPLDLGNTAYGVIFLGLEQVEPIRRTKR
jgi:hypothetical protein